MYAAAPPVAALSSILDSNSAALPPIRWRAPPYVEARLVANVTFLKVVVPPARLKPPPDADNEKQIAKPE
jgi:hypothetical protein